MTRALAKTPPKSTSHRTGWTARVTSSVKSCRSFRTSSSVIVSVLTKNPPAFVNSPPPAGAYGSAETPCRTSSSRSLTEAASRVERVARVVYEDVAERGGRVADRRLEPRGRVVRDDAAAVDDGDAAAEALGLLHVMRREEDGRPRLFAQTLDVLPHGLARDGVEPRRRLVH